MIIVTMKILVADDEEPMLEVISAMLTHAKYEVECASNGIDALRLYRERGPFDFVLTGLAMPGMNGVELMEAVLQENSKQRIAFVTAYSVLQRPFEPEQLLRLIEGK